VKGELSVGTKHSIEEQLSKRLKEGKPLRVYLGVDPTSPNLHVGNFVPVHKLHDFQELGHQVIFLIGDYTAMIGDPSGRDTERRRFKHEELLQNARTYADQAFNILDRDKTEIRYNGEWLSKLTFAEVVELAAIFPLRQIMSRRDFQERLEKGESLRFHEALYALMQGYDAYALECDVQVGAYDQHFNLLAGREIQKHFGQKPHVMLTMPLIMGTDGQKMSKSYRNTIDILDPPEDLYGKTMRISDELLSIYLDHVSGWPANVIDHEKKQLASGENPMEVKKRLARRLVEMFYDAQAAGEAEEHFQRVVQERSAPDEVTLVEVPAELLEGDASWVNVLASLQLTKSKGEARRLMAQGGFYVKQEPVSDTSARLNDQLLDSGEELVIRLGKRRYFKLVRGS
jgi:tyrosyl-tRNA synthetase